MQNNWNMNGIICHGKDSFDGLPPLSDSDIISMYVISYHPLTALYEYIQKLQKLTLIPKSIWYTAIQFLS